MYRTYKPALTFIVSLSFLFPILALACRATSTESSPPAVTVIPAPVQEFFSLPTPVPQQVTIEMNEDQLLVDLYARVNPSVVNITVYGLSNNQALGLGQGSGFVYDDTGNIVTNAHVVHGADQIEVTFSEGTVRPATLVGLDFNSDLAVVKVEQLPPDASTLPLGTMDELAVGQSVVAIGNPFGLSGTLTRGVISALGRTIPALNQFSIPQSIQTDAAINPGNSGGPLLNLRGEVIGVNAQIETDGTSRSNSGVGFAVPVSILRRVVPGLIQDGQYEWSWLGVRGGDVTLPLVTAMSLPVEKGAYFAEISPGGPAEKAGLRGATRTQTVDGRTVSIGGDVVTAINGQPVNSFDDLLVYIALETNPGDQVTLTIVRDGRYQEINVELGARSAMQG